jgi:hypothetical protein
MRQIARAAGADIELVRVPDESLPPDLRLSGTFSQHLLVDTALSREELGVLGIDPGEAIRRSVRWHLEHPPGEPVQDFKADEAALSARG